MNNGSYAIILLLHGYACTQKWLIWVPWEQRKRTSREQRSVCYVLLSSYNRCVPDRWSMLSCTISPLTDKLSLSSSSISTCRKINFRNLYIPLFSLQNFPIRFTSDLQFSDCVQFNLKLVMSLQSPLCLRQDSVNIILSPINGILPTVATMLQSLLCIIAISYTLAPEMLSTNQLRDLGHVTSVATWDATSI